MEELALVTYQLTPALLLGVGKGTYLPGTLYIIRMGGQGNAGANKQKFPCLELTVAEDHVSIIAESMSA